MELEWLDEHVGDNPYGVDIVIPGKYEGMGEMDPVKLEAQLQSMVPDDHRRFARRLLAEHGVPEPPPDQTPQRDDGVDRGHGQAAAGGRASPRQGQAHRQRTRARPRPT